VIDLAPFLSVPDIDGQFITATVIAAHPTLQLFQFRACVDTSATTWDSSCLLPADHIAPASLPTIVTDPFARLAIRDGSDGGVISSGMWIAYSVTDGLIDPQDAVVTNVTILIKAINLAPTTDAQEYGNEVENQMLVMELDAHDADGDEVFVTITEATRHGQLFQAVETSPGVFEAGDEISLATTTSIYVQWAMDATAESSWPFEGNAPAMMIGPADVYPLHGEEK
jgi:hypothetical protein